MFQLPMRSARQALIEILDRDVHSALLYALQAQLQLKNAFVRRRVKRSVNLCHPRVWTRIRQEPGLMPDQADEADIARGITKLIAMGAIGVPGWHERSRLPAINGAASLRVTLF